jgi:hypothetical protein
LLDTKSANHIQVNCLHHQGSVVKDLTSSR